MIDQLILWDKLLLDLLNGWGTIPIDRLMIFMSAKYPWILLYLVLIGALVMKYKSSFWIPLIYVLIVFACDDQFTSGFMKPFFERLRPCHDPAVFDLKVVKGCGGKYGFASSHAANTMGLAFSYFLLFGKQRWTYLLLLWALLVGYSRVYLGVHFPGDVLTGFMVGICFALILKSVTERILTKLNLDSPFC